MIVSSQFVNEDFLQRQGENIHINRPGRGNKLFRFIRFTTEDQLLKAACGCLVENLQPVRERFALREDCLNNCSFP